MSGSVSVWCQGCGWAIWGIPSGTAEGFGRCPTCGDRSLGRSGRVGTADHPVPVEMRQRPRWPAWSGSKGYL